MTGLSFSQFEEILSKIEIYQQEHPTSSQNLLSSPSQIPSLDLPNKLLLTLTWLRHSLTYRILGAMWKIGKSTVERYLKKIVPLLREILNNQIHWLTREERIREIENGNQEKSPTVLVIDGTDHPRFRNLLKEKKYHSVKRGHSFSQIYCCVQ
ncbi:thap domain protein [Anaeramoeba ignava]|uniref:Thap domain protein n=1 Tax=Anaeramoeba ignava TaxID=1746090 RepID=A0A9Q0L6B0_ANAIG|nr:thap domain protein [Anaeramoeba ignava]